MTTSDNISAIEAIEKAMEGGYWAASVYDCRPPRSRRDNPLKHSRIIPVHGKFATEGEALIAGAAAIKSGWVGSCAIYRDTATHSATFELDRRAVSDLVRAMSALLAEARKAGALKREIAEKDARIAALEGGLRVLAEKYTTVTPPREEIFDGARHPDDMADDELALTVFEIGDIRRARTLLNGGSDAQG